MKSTVIAAALLAAFSMPALAEEPVTPATQDSTATLVDPATTAATTADQSEMAPTASKQMYGGCQHRSTAMNMM